MIRPIKYQTYDTSEFTHVQLDDVPRTPIQPSFEGEFRQHDGVMTMMMFYRRKASPKHYNDMIEVEYGGRGHRTRLRNDLNDQLVCLEVPPASVYKGAKGERCAGQEEGAGGVLLLPGVGLPPPILFQLGLGEGVPLPVGSRTHPAPSSWPAAPSPLAPLYTEAGGTSRHTS